MWLQNEILKTAQLEQNIFYEGTKNITNILFPYGLTVQPRRLKKYLTMICLSENGSSHAAQLVAYPFAQKSELGHEVRFSKGSKLVNKQKEVKEGTLYCGQHIGFLFPFPRYN